MLSRYGDYWGGWKSNQFKNVVFQITPEAIVQQQALQSGQVDIAGSVPVENIAKLAKNPEVQGDAGCLVAELPRLLQHEAAAARQRPRPPCARVRDPVQGHPHGRGGRLRQPVPERRAEGHLPLQRVDARSTRQNLAKAKALLARAGHKGGGFSLDLTYAAENAAEGRFAPLIKDAFKKIGVTVNVKSLLFNQQWKLAKDDPTKAQDIFLLLYWPTYSDAGSDNLWSLFHSSKKPFFNLSYIKSPIYDKLVDTAGEQFGTDKKAAQATYEKAMTSLWGAAAGFFLYDADAVFVASKTVNTTGALNINYPFVQFIYPMQQAG